MQNYFGFIFAILLLCHCSNDPVPSVAETLGTGEVIDNKPQMASSIQYEWEITRDPATGTIPKDRLFRAASILRSRSLPTSKSRNEALRWKPLGPVHVGGRTRAIMIDANDPTGNTVYAGSTSGGVYKTTSFKSAQSAWEIVESIDENLSISAMIQDPQNPNVMYIGTGEGWNGINDSRGHGIWKTKDGGSTWQHLDRGRVPVFWYVLDLEMDFHGNVYASTRENGLQRSADGGKNWELVLGLSAGNSDTDNGGDLEIGPDGDLYAIMGILSGGKVYKAAFQSQGETMGSPNTWHDISPTGNYRRIELATAPTDENRLYILCADESRTRVSNMYRSDDGGSQWVPITIPTLAVTDNGTVFSGDAAWFALIAKVDPFDENTLYIGGIDLIRSEDAGATWTHLSNQNEDEEAGYTGNRVVHTDQHEILFFPQSSSEAIITNDGGIYYTTNFDRETPSFHQRNHQYNTTQFYACDIWPDEIIYIGGTQDNGTWAIVKEDLAPGNARFLAEGDGGYTHVNQLDKNFFSLSFTGIDLALSTDGGLSFYTFFVNDRGAWINPYTLDDDTRTYYGAWDDDHYFIISDVEHQQGFETVAVPEFGGAQISAISPDPHVDNRLWVGVREYYSTEWQGRSGFFMIDDAHTKSPTVTDYTHASWHSSLAPRNIYIDHNDPNYMLLTFSNWGSPNVWITYDGAKTWVNVDGDLPDMPVRWGVINPLNPDELIIATELGVLKSKVLNGSATEWIEYQEGTPNLRVNMLAISEDGHRLLAATWGQGLLLTNYYGEEQTPAPLEEIPGLAVYPNPVVSHLVIDGLPTGKESYYKVYDIDGQLMVQGQGSGIATTEWPTGHYLVEIGLTSGIARNVYKVLKL